MLRTAGLRTLPPLMNSSRLPTLATTAQRNTALAALRDLCGLGLHPEVLVPAVLEGLHAVVPSCRNLFDWTDERGRLLHYFIEGAIDTDVARLYFDRYHERDDLQGMPPFRQLGQAPAGISSADELDHPGFYASDYYQAIWRPQGLRTRLQAVLRGRRGQLLGALVLYREPGAPRFTLAEERLLATLLPAFSRGLEAVPAVATSERHVPGPEAPESLLLRLDGTLCHASAGAHRLLMLAEGGVTPERLSGPILPQSHRLLRLLLAQLRERAAQGPLALLAPLPRVTQQAASGQYLAQGQLLRAREPQPGHEPALAQVTLRRLEPHSVALERALRALPITPGQMAVCRWLYHGHAHGQIGQRLGVAPATVVDHVRKAYRRLDLASPLALRALLDTQIGATA